MSSFGGGNTQYTLEYIIKVTNQGGTGGFNQINTGMKQMQTSSLNVTAAMEKMSAANEKVIQAGQGVSKAAKGMAFGFLGIATAGAEAIGMFSMYQQTQAAVKVATDEQTKALAEGGKQSKEYKDATNELVKANRWARMTFRNLMLSMFDLVPFFVLSVNGIVKLRTAYKALREAQLEQAAMKQVLAAAGVKEAAAAELQTASYASLTKQQRLLKAEQALGIKSTQALTLRQDALAASNIAADASLVRVEKSTKAFGATALATAGRIAKIVIPLALIGVALVAFGKNIFGVRDKINQFGVELGNQFPILKGFLDILGKVGDTIVAIVNLDFGKIGSIWNPVNKAVEENTGLTEKQIKAQQELQERLNDSAQSGSDLASEFVEMDKKAKKTFLFEHGIKGGAKSRFKDVVEGFDKIKETVKHFGDDLDFVRLDFQIGKMFDLPKSFFKKVEFTFEDRFREIGKEFGDKGFVALADQLEKAAKKGKGKEGFVKAITEAIKIDPSLMDRLVVIDPATYQKFKDLMDAAGIKLADIAKKSLTNVFGGGAHSGFHNGGLFLGNATNEDVGDTGGGNNEASKNASGMVNGMVEALANAIKTADWNSIGKSVGAKIKEVFTPANMGLAGATIRQYVVDPIVKLLQGAFGEFAAAMQKDPVGTLLSTTDKITLNISEFVAGLLGFGSEQEMFDMWKKVFEADWLALLFEMQMVVDQNPILDALFDTQAEGQSGISTKSIGEAASDPRLQSVFEQTVGQPIRSAWGKFLDTFTKDPIIGDIGLLLTDPIGWIKKHIDLILSTKPAEPAGFKPGKSILQQALEQSLGIDSKNPIQTEVPIKPVPKIVQGESGPNVQGLWDFVGPTSGVDLLGQWGENIMNSLVGNTQKTGLTGPGANGIGGPTWVKEKSFLRLSIPVQVEPTIQNVSDNGEGKGNTFSTQFVEFATQAMSKMQDIWDATLEGMLTVLGKFIEGSTKLFGELTVHVFETYDLISKGWLVIMAGMATATDEIFMQPSMDIIDEDAGNIVDDIFDYIDQGWSDIMDNMTGVADDAFSNEIMDIIDEAAGNYVDDIFDFIDQGWTDVMNHMIRTTADAVNDINSQLDGITKDITVTIHVQKVFEFAHGGLVSAAGGRRFTTNGPTILGNAILGDNPGGVESLWAIPHNNPGKTINDINNFYGTSGKHGGMTSFNQNISLNIDGNDIINDKHLTRRIRTDMGSNMDRFGR